MDILLIDAIGPFFKGYKKSRINWSKIPFDHLAASGQDRRRQWDQIAEDLDLFASRVKTLGYNSVSLDDVVHLSDHPWFEESIRRRNQVFQEEFRRLFGIVKKHGLRIYLTSDFVSTSAAVDARIEGCPMRAANWFGDVLAGVLDDFPEVDGVILRIGESDGLDVTDELRSRLLLRNAGQTNAVLKELLPTFESRSKKLIFRTWTVGSYLIGDLIWHRGTLQAALEGIDSPAFIVSMKYGESDFFRYLPLNRHFFRINLPKIIEFQARREYEGAGEFPSFIGWECERLADELSGADNVVGMSIWCQTGGWHRFRRLAFLQPEAVWIELNAAVALQVVANRKTVPDAVHDFWGPQRAGPGLELLRLSDRVMNDLYYIREFAQQKLFFRRVRIPPLLHVYWDSVFVQHVLRRVLQHFVTDPEAAIREGEAAFEQFGEMEQLARRAELPHADIVFMRDTCELILLARRYLLLPPDEELIPQIKKAKKNYKRRWPKENRTRFRIRLGFSPGRMNRRTVNWLLALLIRRQRGYRHFMDRLLTLNMLSWIYLLFKARHRKAIPKFLRKSAMGFDSLLR